MARSLVQSQIAKELRGDVESDEPKPAKLRPGQMVLFYLIIQSKTSG